MTFAKWEEQPDIGRRVGGGFDGWLKIVYRQHHDFTDVRNDPVHWTPSEKPMDESRIALVTTAGVHHKDDKPFDVLALEGDSSFRRIASDVASSELMITHSHYNHQEADQDVNCVFPIDTLNDLAHEGFVRSVATEFYGMMGFIPNPTRFVNETAIAVANGLREQEVDIVVLSPG